MAFELGQLDLQFNATLTNCHRLMLQQPEGVDFLFLGSAARHLVQRVLQPLSLACRFFFADTQLHQPVRH